MRYLTTTDGRQLELLSLGDPDGFGLLFHHGTPGAAPLARFLEPLALQRGYRVVAMSRAGYGKSDRRQGRAICDVVPDATNALDFLDMSSYLSVGWSGGGPHALACGALDAPRCRGVVSLAGVAPYSGTFEWTEGMGPENIEEMNLALKGGDEYEAHIKSVSDAGREVTVDSVIELFGGLLSPVDKDALADDQARSQLAEAMRYSGVISHYGFLDDDQAFLRPWGFDLSDVQTPTEIWFGDHDLMVPPTHGNFLAAAIPAARRVHLPDEGHVSLITRHLDMLFDHLDEMRKS